MSDISFVFKLQILTAKGLVTLVGNDPEGPLVDGTSDTGNGVGSILAGVPLLHPLGADLLSFSLTTKYNPLPCAFAIIITPSAWACRSTGTSTRSQFPKVQRPDRGLMKNWQRNSNDVDNCNLAFSALVLSFSSACMSCPTGTKS